MATVKDQVAHMYNIGMLKMHKAVTIGMPRSIIMKAYLFFAVFLAPGICISKVGV